MGDMKKQEVLEHLIKQLQEKLNKHIEEKGFQDYEALLRISRELDDVLNEWIMVNTGTDGARDTGTGNFF